MDILYQNIGNAVLILIMGVVLYLLICAIKNKILMPYISYKTEERYLNVQVTEDTYAVLDRFISEIFDEYRILNLEFRDIEYINSEMEKNILEDIITLVNYKMSPQLLNKVYSIYDITSNDKIQDLIYRRVYIQLLNYIMEKNKLKVE